MFINSSKPESFYISPEPEVVPYYKDGKNWRAQQKDTQHQIDREEKSDFIKSIEDISQEER